MHLLHELLHRLAAVVASDVGMQVFPSSLDPVVIRAVGRKEVQLDPLALRRLQCDFHLLGMVDGVVVEDDMDCLGIRILLRQFP